MITIQKHVPPIIMGQVHLVAPPCSVGITDGSERGDYVPQSHLLRVLGRPHHIVNLMFQYYPDIEGWPTQGINWRGFYRNNSLNKGDGYFPLVLEEGGRWGQLYLRQIEDVRSHGQEPQLTLTLHTSTSDADLIRIAQSLRPYTPLRIRINHECNGTWFYFNQVSTYKEVSDFFVRFHRILHTHAPGVCTVACWNGPGDMLENGPSAESSRGQLTEEQLAPMFRIADIVSIDQYFSLHYGWPDPSFDRHRPTASFRIAFETWWQIVEHFHDKICELRGSDTPIEVHEVNEDADLVGFDGQAQWITRFYNEVLRRKLAWLANVTFYQFRDRGGLGLELENLNDSSQFEALPSLAAYRDAIQNEFFQLRIETQPDNPISGAVTLRWESSIKAIGIACDYPLPREVEKIRLRCQAASCLLVEHGGEWLRKPPGQTHIHVRRKTHSELLRIHVFAVPPDGRNTEPQAYSFTLNETPILEL